MSAIFSSFYKTVASPGTPVAFGAATVQFNVGIIVPQKSATEENAGNVSIIQTGGTGEVVLVPGQTPYIVRAPMNTAFKATDFTVDSDTAGDGILFVYSFAAFNSYHSIEQKLENAMRKLIDTISSTIDDCSITTGLSEDERTGDNIRCVVAEADEEILDSALWRCKAQVIVQTRMRQDDALELHRLRTAYVRDLFMASETEALLSSLEPNFSVQESSICQRKLSSGLSSDQATPKYLSIFSFEVCCCGNQIF